MQFLTTVCMAAIASALFRMMLPEGKFTKPVSLLIVCLFLLAGASALKGADFSIPDCSDIGVSEDYIGFSGEVNRSLQKKICSEMSDRLFALLNENGCFPDEIHVIVNISGLYSIEITQVKLVFPPEMQDAAAAAAELVREELPEEIAVSVVVKE